MSRVNVTTADGAYLAHFDWDKAARWSDADYNGNGSGGTGRGEAVMLTSGGRWVLEHWTRWQGQRNRYEYITAEQAREWLLLNHEDKAVAEHFGEIAEEEDRRGGRPEIGKPVHVRLGDLLTAVDEFAGRAGLTRAAAVRALAAYGLRSVTLTAGMKPIVFSCNVVTGRIEAETGDWADDDARWDFLTDPRDGMLANGTTVEPWGEDEFGMERATDAVRLDLGFTVTDWEEQSGIAGELKFATVTGRA